MGSMRVRAVVLHQQAFLDVGILAIALQMEGGDLSRECGEDMLSPFGSTRQ